MPYHLVPPAISEENGEKSSVTAASDWFVVDVCVGDALTLCNSKSIIHIEPIICK